MTKFVPFVIYKTAMKRLFLFLVATLTVACASATQYMVVNKTDGQTVEYLVSDVKEVTFKEVADVTPSDDDNNSEATLADSIVGGYNGKAVLNTGSDISWTDSVVVTKTASDKVTLNFTNSKESGYMNTLSLSNLTVSKNDDGSFSLDNSASDFSMESNVLSIACSTSNGYLKINSLSGSVVNGVLSLSVNLTLNLTATAMNLSFEGTLAE